MTSRTLVSVALIGLLRVPIAQGAPEGCSLSNAKSTPSGEVQRMLCGNAQAGYRESILVNGKPVLSDTRLFDDASSTDRLIRIYTSGRPNPATACADRLYLLDLTGPSPRALAFGVQGACNEFHWSSWGTKRSVIALKHNVKFVYEDGKLTLPEKGTALWKAIEPPHVGEGLGEEDAIPFVQEMLRPK